MARKTTGEMTTFSDIIVADNKDPLYFVSSSSPLLPIFYSVVLSLSSFPVTHPPSKYSRGREMVRGRSVLMCLSMCMDAFIRRARSRGHWGHFFIYITPSDQAVPISQGRTGVK